MRCIALHKKWHGERNDSVLNHHKKRYYFSSCFNNAGLKSLKIQNWESCSSRAKNYFVIYWTFTELIIKTIGQIEVEPNLASLTPIKFSIGLQLMSVRSEGLVEKTFNLKFQDCNVNFLSTENTLSTYHN